jgi:hypothetical protein
MLAAFSTEPHARALWETKCRPFLLFRRRCCNGSSRPTGASRSTECDRFVTCKAIHAAADRTQVVADMHLTRRTPRRTPDKTQKTSSARQFCSVQRTTSETKLMHQKRRPQPPKTSPLSLVPAHLHMLMVPNVFRAVAIIATTLRAVPKRRLRRVDARNTANMANVRHLAATFLIALHRT